ncbi:hypothetical protein [Marinobacter salicampi]|uniref:hypothetical protein n=1 Tax=Marinobacter salicampi TaxID=435907 RepID=UPI001A948CB3|nr:hypothetical protein [Marinobacter salicampi]
MAYSSIPHFLDIEYCESDEGIFPVAMAWSLDDGRMKVVVIEPDDDWLPEDGDAPDVDLRYLREQGVPLIELARSLHEDLPDQTVYVDGLDPDDALVEMIFESVGMEQPFELASVSSLLTHLDQSAIEDARQTLIFEEGLDPRLPETGVYALLLMAQQAGMVDPEDQQSRDL